MYWPLSIDGVGAFFGGQQITHPFNVFGGVCLILGRRKCPVILWKLDEVTSHACRTFLCKIRHVHRMFFPGCNFLLRWLPEGVWNLGAFYRKRTSTRFWCGFWNGFLRDPLDWKGGPKWNQNGEKNAFSGVTPRRQHMASTKERAVRAVPLTLTMAVC